MKVYQQSDVDFVHPICNFIKSEALVHAFSCELCKFSHPAILLEKNLRHRSALVNLGIFFRQQLYQKWDSRDVFSREFWEVFQPATLLKPRPRHRRFPVNFAKLLTTSILQNICEELLLMIWLLLDSFVNFIVH